MLTFEIKSFNLTSLDTRGVTQINQTFYFLQFTKQAHFAWTTTCIYSIGNYAVLLALFTLNTLIYFELRKTIINRRHMITNLSIIMMSSTIVLQRMGATNNTSFILPQVMSPASVALRREERKRSLRRSLVMCLWISLIFSVDRTIKAINRTCMFFDANSSVSFFLNAFGYLSGNVVRISFLFVYMRTNKMFCRKFYELFD